MTLYDRVEIHSHTWYSNIRLLDSINSPYKLIDRAIELGLNGIAITDHECLSAAVKVNQYQKQISKENPNFKIMLGNEVYLCGDRCLGQEYFHFILIAKNKEGFKALKELSSRAWMSSYFDRGYERVVTLYSDIEEVMSKYPNSLIATTACLGGLLSSSVVKLDKAEKIGDKDGAAEHHQNIVNFMLWCKQVFGDDFYVECAPGCSREQIIANKRLKKIAEAFDVNMVVGTDAHFLTLQDRYVHKAYLTSQDGEREVDAFYEYAYLQSNEEIVNNLSKSEYSEEFIKQMFLNSMNIYDKVKIYDITHTQQIPTVPVKDYEKTNFELQNYPVLSKMFKSDDKVQRYWANECVNALKEKGLFTEVYLSELEEEARTKSIISEKLNNNMFQYPVTLQYYIDMIWECGSTIGAGRGSACAALNHYLLGVTQLDPIKHNLPFFRYMNDERIELADIDIDIASTRRPTIIKKIKEQRKQYFNDDIDYLSKENLGCTFVATFGTETTKAAIQTACRGYRSDEYPDGIDNDTALYLSSLVPVERGFTWSVKDVYYGNREKGRRPVQFFVNEIDKYPRLLEIIETIEGVVKSRGIHASGVIMFDEDPYEFGCFMKAPNGEIVTQFDLHDAEAAGMTKFDFLVTEIQDKLITYIDLLQQEGIIEKDLSLREVYNKYLHPDVLPLDNPNIWTAIEQGTVLDLFQFDSEVGRQAAKKIKPKNIVQLSDANGLLRLMPEDKNAETPLDKYVRYKDDINLWYQEMNLEGLTKEEQKTIEPYFLSSFGVPPSQEQMMLMLMDPDICGFSLTEANSSRKIVGKKQMDKIPSLKEMVLSKAKSKNLGQYIWNHGVVPQLGYAFSTIHALAYSFIGFQSAYAATVQNPIYWNTACLMVNSGALESDEEDAKDKSTNYGKLATAIGSIRSRGINVSLIDINNSSLGFKPDVENNEILFGLKGVNRVGSDVIEKIIEGRPYKGIKDFMARCPLNKTIMVSLIKAGAFDKIDQKWAAAIHPEPRIAIMAYYLAVISSPKENLNLTNFSSLIKVGLVPDELQHEVYVYNFNKYLKNFKYQTYYKVDVTALSFYQKHYSEEHLNVIDGNCFILQKTWEKIYNKEMDKVRSWIVENKQSLLDAYNAILFKEMWDKYATGNLSSWEMEAVSFYHHPHELIDVDMERYGISDFNKLNPESEIDYYYKRNGKQLPIYKIHKIIGTVIAKNDPRAMVTLLTPTGIVNVKFSKEYYSIYKRQISKRGEDGKKKVVEKGWFTKGRKLLIMGYRREDQFVAKTYKNTNGHQIYLITDVKDGEINITHDRAEGVSEDVEEN